MNILIVHAHPEPQSFTTAMKDKAIEKLENDGHTVKVSDLYEMDWNPIASAQDFGDRKNKDYLIYALEQRHCFDNGSIAKDIQEEVEKVLWADLVIFSFPIYWFSVPAIMKGWFDRVFLSGKIYGGLRFYDQGGMAGKKAMIACTLGGQEHMFGEDAIHGPFQDMLRHVLRGTLRYAGFDVLPPFVGWHVPYISQEAREEFLVKYEDYLDKLDTHEPLTFPTMDQFDERLMPLKVRAS